MPRLIYDKTCNYCGDPFQGGRLAKYCSDACRVATHYYCTLLKTHRKCSECGWVFEIDDGRVTRCEECRCSKASTGS